MQAELTHREAKNLFGAFIDEDLEEREALRLRAHLEICDDCRTGWDRYERAVKVVRGVDRERAPEGLATQILRRVRRRRFGARALAMAHANYRVPAEIIIIPLVAAAVAALIYFVAH